MDKVYKTVKSHLKSFQYDKFNGHASVAKLCASGPINGTGDTQHGFFNIKGASYLFYDQFFDPTNVTFNDMDMGSS